MLYLNDDILWKLILQLIRWKILRTRRLRILKDQVLKPTINLSLYSAYNP